MFGSSMHLMNMVATTQCFQTVWAARLWQNLQGNQHGEMGNPKQPKCDFHSTNSVRIR